MSNTEDAFPTRVFFLLSHVTISGNWVLELAIVNVLPIACCSCGKQENNRAMFSPAAAFHIYSQLAMYSRGSAKQNANKYITIHFLN